MLNEEKIVAEFHATGEVPVETDVWYLDNGASNHMTSHQNKFKQRLEQIQPYDLEQIQTDVCTMDDCSKGFIS